MRKILLSLYMFVNLNLHSQTITKIENPNIHDNSFKLYILMYKEKVIDVVAVSNIASNPEWKCDGIIYHVNKNSLSPEHALDLIGNYFWRIEGNYLKKEYCKYKDNICDYHKTLYYSRDKYIEPNYITIKTESFIYQLNK